MKYYDNDFTETDEFWNSFKIVLMPPGGHCLLHAVSLSMASQLEVSDTSVDMLLKLLEETINNIEHCKAFVVK